MQLMQLQTVVADNLVCMAYKNYRYLELAHIIQCSYDQLEYDTETQIRIQIHM